MHEKTGGSPVYRYSFDRKIPVAPGTKVNGKAATAADIGARHAGEIEYVFGALDSLPDVPWEAADRALSDQMMAYWSNFARTGDPNGPGLPAWPRYEGGETARVMHLDVTSRARPDATRARYETLDALAAAARAVAQMPRPEPTPNDTLVSTEIAPDRTVTFRIYAPKASEVGLRGDWMEGFGTEPLARDDQGVWSVSVGPLAPDFYNYFFVVDGVKTVDPEEPRDQAGHRQRRQHAHGPGPGGRVPGGEAGPARRDPDRLVPVDDARGRAAPARLHAARLRRERRALPGLLPAARGRRRGLRVEHHRARRVHHGQPARRREGAPHGHRDAERQPSPPGGPARGSCPDATPSPEVVAAWAALQARFTSELMNDVVPFVEKTYRVRTDPASRAIAGLSMGGGQTQRVLITHPDAFAYVAIWSAGVRPECTEAFEKEAASFLAAPEKVNEAIRLLSIRVGGKDFALAG